MHIIATCPIACARPGHVHSYERTNPVYNYVNNQCGIVYITIGDAGNSEGLSGINTEKNGTIDHSAHRFPCCPAVSFTSS